MIPKSEQWINGKITDGVATADVFGVFFQIFTEHLAEHWETRVQDNFSSLFGPYKHPIGLVIIHNHSDKKISYISVESSCGVSL